MIQPLREFLGKREGKVCILYGIDPRDDHHGPTIAQLEKLREEYGQKQFYLLNLPEHFKNMMLDMSGSHRKIVLKDTELSIKGSFNFLSNNAEPDQMFAAEEATVFYDGTLERWKGIFEEYQLPVRWLDFLLK